MRLRGWLTRVLKDWASVTVLLDAQAWGDISGADAALVPAMVPTADPALRAGRRPDASLGVNFFAPRGLLEGSRLSLLAGLPLHQRLDGPQLETDLFLSLQWRWTFGGE